MSISMLFLIILFESIDSTDTQFYYIWKKFRKIKIQEFISLKFTTFEEKYQEFIGKVIILKVIYRSVV
jgi:hypothetical protein